MLLSTVRVLAIRFYLIVYLGKTMNIYKIHIGRILNEVN